MKKILIIGSGGAGKSTFAQALGTILKLPVIHLDTFFWKPGWIGSTKDDWRETVSDLVRRDTWIMDGNFGDTMELRLAACDTVIFLDLSRWVCLRSILKRRIMYHGRSRPDLPEGCLEHLSWEFLHWVWTYPARAKPEALARIEKHTSGKKVIILKSRKETAQFLKTLPPASFDR